MIAGTKGRLPKPPQAQSGFGGKHLAGLLRAQFFALCEMLQRKDLESNRGGDRTHDLRIKRAQTGASQRQ